MELNKYFFEALRMRLENILRALSNNRKAHIVYNNCMATDVKNTVYLQARDYIEPDVKPSLAELLLFYKARVSHEGAHLRFTSLDDWKEACSRGPIFQHLTNIIEDGRIEAAISQILPGAGRWIKFTNQYNYQHRKPEAYGTGLDAFLMGLNVYSILQTVPPFLPSETQRLIKLAAPYVDIGRAASATKEVLNCVEKILAIPEIKSLVDASTPPQMIEGDKGTTSSEKTTPSNEISERAEKAEKIIQHRSRDKDSNEDNSEKESSDKTKEDSDSNEDSKNSQDAESSKVVSDTEDAEDTSDNTNNSEETLEDLDENGEEVSDSQDNQENDETLSDTGENTSSNEEFLGSPDNEIKDEETSENPDEGNNTEDSENEELDNSDNDFNNDANDDIPEESDQSGDDVSEDDFDSEDFDNNDDFDSEDFEAELDSSAKNHSSENAENNDSEIESSTSEDSESHGEPGNPSNDGNDEEEFFANPPEEDFDELLEDTNEEVLTLAKEAESIEEENTPADILEGIPMNIHGSLRLQQIELPHNSSAYQRLKKQNEVLIKNLVNEIKVALETRKAYDLRSLNRGRLHSGSLWKLAVPDPAVFSRRIIPGDIPELAVYILVDLSGSMDTKNTGGNITRIESVQNAACVLSETMRQLKIVHAVTGFQGAYPRTYHYPAVTWDDTESDKIASFSANNSNRDGYSIRIAANELSYRQEPKKILFVLSDGQPADGHYPPSIAHNDVKQAVFETKNKGIKLISLFFGDEYIVPYFKLMYDTPVFVPNLTILPRALGEVFKKIYLE